MAVEVEMGMLTAQQLTLAECALSEIEQLLNTSDLDGSIESVLPLLIRHRRTLVELRDASQSARAATTRSDDKRWRDDIETVLRKYGGQAPHRLLYRKVKELRQATGRTWPRSAHSRIRQTLQSYNAESRQYRGGTDLFRVVRQGLWRLKEHESS